MGSDFSPTVWEICRRLAAQLSASLFGNKSLVTKHRDHLDKLRWSKHLRKAKPDKITPTASSTNHKGVRDEHREPVNTYHNLFVNDDIIVEVYQMDRIAFFILLGDSNILVQQDTIPWDKLYKNDH